MTSKILIALAVVVAVLALSEGAVVPRPFRSALQDEQNCKCMNWRDCTTEINNDVYCQGSYIFVCCIIDPVVDNVPDEKSKIIADQINN